MLKKNKSTKQVGYAESAYNWETNLVKSIKATRTLAVMWATFSSIIAILAVGALFMLIPLKSYEPYLISVDEQTGYLKEIRPLAQGNLQQDEAVTTANIVRFIRNRENFDLYTIKQNHYIAQLLSTGSVQNDFNKILDPNNKQNLIKKYGQRVKITTFIKSVSKLNNSTYSVRFKTVNKENTTTLTQHWVSILRMKYTQKPMSNEYRFDNPLGFQVTSYTKEQETILPDENGNRIAQ